MTSTQHTTLNSGLRVITDHVPSVDSVAIGVWVGCGTRDEDLKNNGAAHMVEHMLFKGTKTRDAKTIVAEIEEVGGNMNAYTSREVTSYHIHLMKDNTALALEVLGDMAQHSTLPEEEIERERHVILQEIGMTHDTPDDLIFDHYYETAYQGQALGAPILGTAEIITKMQRGPLENHIAQFYTPGNMVVSAAGNIDHEELVKQVEDVFNALPADQDLKKVEADYTGGERRGEKELEQAHIVLGFQGISRFDDHYYTAQVLSNILGGGMSSRLFQEVREKRGLAYAVFSFHSGYQDDGLFGIYAGTGPEDVTDLMPVLCDEALKATQDIKEAELARAKSQLKAGTIMARESMMARADQQAKYLLQRNEVFCQEELVAKINAIDLDTVQQTAQKIFTGKPTLCALGPLEKLESYEGISSRLAA